MCSRGESREQQMELLGRFFKLRIRLTQVGDHLAHRRMGFANGVSSDKLSRLASLLAADAKDKEATELVLLSEDITEG